MAVRGSIAKEEIIKKIMETFPGSFINGKELRIPWHEGAEDLQIKVTLTAAKENIDNPNETKTFGTVINFPTENTVAEVAIDPQPSAEEKENLRLLMNKLGL